MKNLALILFAFYYLILLLTGVPSALLEKKLGNEKLAIQALHKEDNAKVLLVLSSAFEEEENVEQLSQAAPFIVLNFLYQLVFDQDKTQDHFAHYEDLNISPYKVSLFVLDRVFRI
ncbi:MAG: hypothetical protein KDC82_07905 [Bacteroidetes bacterium]|nr:hypothetical protein [Bacteroidota bacterium]